MKLYRYYGNLDYAYQAILENQLYFYTPVEINDIFDGIYQYNTLEDFIGSESEIFSIIMSFIDSVLIFNDNLCDLQENFASHEIKNAKEVLIAVKEYLRKHNRWHNIIDCSDKTFIEFLNNNYRYIKLKDRLCCFTTKPLSDLMWAHYGNSHMGIVLCFETDENKDLFKDLIKINYVDKIDSSQNLYVNKKNVWEYEDEYRLIRHASNDGKVPYVKLDSVILGVLFDEKKNNGKEYHQNEETKRKIKNLLIEKNIRTERVYIEDLKLYKVIDQHIYSKQKMIFWNNIIKK